MSVLERLLTAGACVAFGLIGLVLLAFLLTQIVTYSYLTARRRFDERNERRRFDE